MGKLNRAKTKAKQLAMTQATGRKVPRYEAERELERDRVKTTQESTPLSLGSHRFREMDNGDAAFGARLSDYPPENTIPVEFHRHNNRYAEAVSTLFFRGGRLSDFGLNWKNPRNVQYSIVLRALLSSFDPSHNHKTAAVAWFLSEHTEDV